MPIQRPHPLTSRLRSARWLVVALISIAASIVTPALGAENLTFLQLSDVHFPYAQDETRKTIAALPTTGPIRLGPYGVVVPAPSFAFVTGDLNEFSGGAGDWEAYMRLWDDVPFPVYHQLGNHDNTWDSGRPRLRRLHGDAFYAFERAGYRFIGWDTATPQDPRPSVAAEGLAWLEGELKRTAPDQPVFFFGHHPLDGREFAGDYDRSRLLDPLQTRNVALMLVGHGHGRRAWKIRGIDTAMGGSTYGKHRGYSVVSVMDGTLRVCHKVVGDNPREVAILEKPLAARPLLAGPPIVFPADGAVLKRAPVLEWSARFSASEPLRDGVWRLDDGTTGSLARDGDAWRARVDGARLDPGAHTIRFDLRGAGARHAKWTVAFWLDDGPIQIAWKRKLGGSCQSTPTAMNGRLYVGANDGYLYSCEAVTGRPLWRFHTEGEIRSQPLALPSLGLVCFGSADGALVALDADGERRWRMEAGSPIHASPVLVGDRVVVGTSAGDVLAVDAASGDLRWRCEAPEYAIEAPVCSGAGMVWAGAWDRFVYALDARDGALRYRVPSKGSDRQVAARYYSPADCGPLFADGRVFIADRAYALTVLDADSGKRVLSEKGCVAVGASPDGRFVYTRHTDGRIGKRRPDGTVVWEAKVPTGAIPTPPIESHGVVWALSNTGLLSAIDAESGATLAQYKAFPDLFALAAPAFDGQRVYLADAGGNLLALSMEGASVSAPDARAMPDEE